MPRVRGVTRSVQDGKAGYLLVQSDRRDTTAVVEDIRFMPDWNTKDTMSAGKINNNDEGALAKISYTWSRWRKIRYTLNPRTNHTPGTLGLAIITSYLF